MSWFAVLPFRIYQGLLFVLRPAKETLFDYLVCGLQIRLSALAFIRKELF